MTARGMSVVPGVKPCPIYGTVQNAYVQHGCRCEVCVENRRLSAAYYRDSIPERGTRRYQRIRGRAAADAIEWLQNNYPDHWTWFMERAEADLTKEGRIE